MRKTSASSAAAAVAAPAQRAYARADSVRPVLVDAAESGWQHLYVAVYA